MANRYAELRGVDEVLRDMDRIDAVMRDGRLVKWAGPRIRDAITRRTQQGIDIHEAPFEPYSARYGKLKGRRSPVTLAGTARYVRGGGSRVDPPQMLNLVQHRVVSRTQGRVEMRRGGSPDRRMVGEAHNRGLGNVPKRQWWGLSRGDLSKLNEDTIDYLDDELRGAVRASGGLEVRGDAVAGAVAWTGDASGD